MIKSNYWKDYAKRLTKLENKYQPRVYRALMNQVDDFTNGLRNGKVVTDKIWNQGIGKVLRQMHIEGAVSEGRYQARQLRMSEKKGFGTNEEWTRQIIELLQLHNAKFVVSITETTREYLLQKVQEGLAEGLSLNEIADMLDKEVPQIYENRSFAIARTELNRATNLGTQLAAKDYGYLTDKTWITAGDHRVRDGSEPREFDHVHLNGTKIDSDKPFNNGEDIMQPGDPNASPGNTINCRCTIALTGKRDADGRLIKKPTRLLSTI